MEGPRSQWVFTKVNELIKDRFDPNDTLYRYTFSEKVDSHHNVAVIERLFAFLVKDNPLVQRIIEQWREQRASATITTVTTTSVAGGASTTTTSMEKVHKKEEEMKLVNTTLNNVLKQRLLPLPKISSRMFASPLQLVIVNRKSPDIGVFAR